MPLPSLLTLKWANSPGFVQWNMRDMTVECLSKAPEETFRFYLSKEVLNLSDDGQVKVVIDPVEYEGTYQVTCESLNGIVETEWGEWSDDGRSIMLYIYPLENGDDVLYISNDVNDFVRWINVTVTGI